ncbi:hypothetical protein ACFFRR_008151 [Megaselia abdita]
MLKLSRFVICILISQFVYTLGSVNNWYLHTGATTFYRFFRDKITWFEADAVCQFNHAHLATISNSYEFDRAQEYLKDLDVSDIVWIGLKRSEPDGSFVWSSPSYPVTLESGYWAESLPACSNPLCVTLDPMKNFRWHAIRCSGPETASFLCEMPVPDWLQRCIIRDLPNLAIQYTITTGEVYLTRHCGDTKLTTNCEERKDIDAIYNDLMCPDEKYDRKWEILRKVKTNNTEDNKISVEKVLKTFQITEKESDPNVVLVQSSDELMLGDQPMEDIANEIEEGLPIVKNFTTLSSLTTESESSTQSLLSTTPPLLSSTVFRNFATIGHPMYPQQPKAIIITTNETGHVKESINDNYFIPPMLMVKSQYHPRAYERSPMNKEKETAVTESTSSTTISQNTNTDESTEESFSTDESTETTTPAAPTTKNLNLDVTAEWKPLRKRLFMKSQPVGYLKRILG